MSNYRVYFCHNDHCKRRGAQAAWVALRQAVREHGLEESSQLIVSGCQGRCDYGPNITVHPGATKYSAVGPDDVNRIAEEHLAAGRVVDDLVYDGW
jgi:NADH-quinone oxidoreductase subunit F